MRNTVEVLGVNIDKVTFDEAVDKLDKFMNTEGVSAVFTPNPEIVMAAYEDAEFRDILNSAELCTADGIGVVYASRMLKDAVPERVAGFDMTCEILSRAAKSGNGVFLFGSKPGVAEAAKAKMEEKYSGIRVVGTRNGYFKPEDNDEIVEEINSSGADLLLVCLGAPKQEKWIAENRESLKVRLCMGVGGTLDVFAGTSKRAPKIFIKLNLEWLYRGLKQPSRLIRFVALPKFMLEVMKNKNKKK